MKTFDQENEEQEISDAVENEMFAALISEIEGRCQTVKFNFEKTIIDGFDEDVDQIVYKIEMPSGRYKRSIPIYGYNAALRISQIDFESYILFHEYTGICSYAKGMIEVGIQAPNRMPYGILKRRLFGNDIQPDEELCAIIEQPTELGNISISIGKPSKEFLVLNDLSRIRNLKLTFKINGLTCTTYEKALKALENFSNSLFFQIDLKKNMPISLLRENIMPLSRGKKNTSDIRGNLCFPSQFHDTEPISLYWYARNSTGIPLLQYLAFYQTIEFYFPVYSDIEASRVLKLMLKSPIFNPNSEIDISKVLSAVKSKIGKGFENERSQLKATLGECINVESLKTFIRENQMLSDYYKNNDYKKLSKSKINIENSDEDFMNAFSERIYDIRCKIVHTKASSTDGNIELLLPFSKEIENLYLDIEIIMYASQQVLIYNSKDFPL